jgi:hypothetical protein
MWNGLSFLTMDAHMFVKIATLGFEVWSLPGFAGRGVVGRGRA